MDSFLNYRLAKEFGWTPAQVDEIDEVTLFEIMCFIGAFDEKKARDHEEAMRKAK